MIVTRGVRLSQHITTVDCLVVVERLGALARADRPQSGGAGLTGPQVPHLTGGIKANKISWIEKEHVNAKRRYRGICVGPWLCTQ